MTPSSVTLAVTGRMNVNTLLNPVSVTPRLVPLYERSVPGSTPTQVYCLPPTGLHPYSTMDGTIGNGGMTTAIRAYYQQHKRQHQEFTRSHSDYCTQQTNSKDGFEKVLCRKESEFGPPTPNNRCFSESGATQNNSDIKKHYFYPHQPHIFVPVPPLVGYGALSKDRSAECITTPYPNEDDNMFIFDSTKAAATIPPSLCAGYGSPLAFCSDSPWRLATENDNGLMSLPPAKRTRLDTGNKTISSGCAAYDDSETASVFSPTSEFMGDYSQTSADIDGDGGTMYNASYSGVIGISDVSLLTTLPPSASPLSAKTASVEHGVVCRAETSALADTTERKIQRVTSNGERKVTALDALAVDSSSDTDNSKSTTNDTQSGVKEKALVDWRALEVPESIWDEAQVLYNRVKTLKEVQSRQPLRKKHVILAALMFILCRNKNYPRTFVEICAAANATKREIGVYYKLMRKVLGREYTSIQRAKPLEFLNRWCAVLELPKWIAKAASLVYERADEKGIVQGKCPISVSAASMWLVIWSFNYRHGLHEMNYVLPDSIAINSNALPSIPGLAISTPLLLIDQREVCKAASVVTATLVGVFKQLFPEIKYLVNGIFDNYL
ncbi:hypothetical protein H4S08_001433 [Coemansia sp. RSA 1365]|nr:hypothetical protein H4S08_001433 [Coemansia sp. RSA 1365]